MKTIQIRLYKEPNMRKAKAHPRAKNPDTLGPCPYTHPDSYELTESEFLDFMAGGKERERLRKKVEEKLRGEGYKGEVNLLEHRSPRCNHKLPKYFRKGRGPREVFSWVIL